MTGNANVNLSEKELMVVTNTEWILTKHLIINKVYDLFGKLSELYQQQELLLQPEIIAVPPKIYKGEQYLQLPYVMMDYPRYFKGGDALAIRHFFWWGNYFSIVLHLSGSYKKMHEQVILQHYEALAESNWYICVNSDPWQHHFEPSNYQPMPAVDKDNLVINSSFIKIAKKIPLYEWDNAYNFFTGNFMILQNLLTNAGVK